MSEETPDFNQRESSEMAELEAAEALQSEQEFSSEEQERLVSMVTDPNLSMYILGFDDANARRLTASQAEKLFVQALTDREVVEIFHTTLTESGVELNKNETLWLQRVQEAREQYSRENPEI
jgi:hypothetical protein